MYKLLVIVLPLVLFSCVNKNKKVPINTSINTRIHDIWVLTSIHQKEIKIDYKSQRPMIEINTSEMTFLGNDGCNRFSGSIKKLTDKNIKFGQLRSTMMACPDSHITNRFLENMEQISSYVIKGLKLIFLDKEGIELLIFQKVD